MGCTRRRRTARRSKRPSCPTPRRWCPRFVTLCPSRPAEPRRAAIECVKPDAQSNPRRVSVPLGSRHLPEDTMPIPVTVPRLGWNMDEGTFVEWVKADGDPVRPGDVVFKLEGEKATEEVTSLDAGTLYVPADGPRPGDRVQVGAVIGFLLRDGEELPSGRSARSASGATRAEQPGERDDGDAGRI